MLTPVNLILLKFRSLVLTDFPALAAPSMEMAARWRIHRRRYIPLQNYPLFLMMDIRYRNRRQR